MSMREWPNREVYNSHVYHLLKLFDATLFDSSESHLHYCDFRHSFEFYFDFILDTE